MKNLLKYALAALMLTAVVQQAGALTIGDTRYVGRIDFGIPAGDQDRENYVNYLIDMAAPSSQIGPAPGDWGQDYYRSANTFAAPFGTDAVFATTGGNGGSYNVGSGYLYMLAKYDGPNYGSEVWYIGGLTGTVTVPSTAGGYGLSGVAFFNGTPTTTPDGGSTMLLLGSALAGIGLIRRKLS